MNSGKSGFIAGWLPELVTVNKRMVFWAICRSEFYLYKW